MRITQKNHRLRRQFFETATRQQVLHNANCRGIREASATRLQRQRRRSSALGEGPARPLCGWMNEWEFDTIQKRSPFGQGDESTPTKPPSP